MTPPPPNHEKRERYAYAFEQIKRASEAGFYIEVVAICESIITDRLQSNAVGTGAVKWPQKEDGYLSLGGIIGKLRSKLPSSPEASTSENRIDTAQMLDDIDAWRNSRNAILHGLVKSEPGTSLGTVDEFRKMARHSAEGGKDLARMAIRWHEQQPRAAAQPSA